MADVTNNSNAETANVIEKIQSWLTYDVRLPGSASGLFGTDNTKTSGDANAFDCAKQIHMLPIPAWIPDSYIRSQKRNLYLSMLNSKAVNGSGTLEFFKEGSGDWKGMLQNAANSALTLVSNQVGAMANTAQGLAEGVANMFGESTYEKSNVTDPFLENQPYVKIFGMNPTPDLAANLEIVRQAWNMVKSIMNTDNGMGDFLENMKKALLRAIAEYLSPAGQSVSINSVNDLWQVISDKGTREHSLMERMLVNCTTAIYMQEARIPFIDTESPMFQSCEGSYTSSFGGGGGGEIGDAISKFTGLQIGSIKKLEWNPQGTVDTSVLRTKFTMYNDTLDHLIANFYFMLGFSAGTKPTTDTIFLRSPYLYDIEIPGGGRYRLCTCNSSFTPKGKMRKISRWMLYDIALASPWGSGNIMNMEDMMYFPDAWEVSMSFTSKLPDSWNFISNYYFGQQDMRPKIGCTLENLMGKFMKSFADNLKAAEGGS